jgi:hypothetical protein
MIKKTGKGKAVIVHCHGSNKGKRINATKRPVSVTKAKKIHRAIQANKHK